MFTFLLLFWMHNKRQNNDEGQINNNLLTVMSERADLSLIKSILIHTS